MLQAGLISRVIGRVFLGGQTLPQTAGLLQALLLVIFLRAALVWVGELSAHDIARRVKSSLRAQLYQRLLEVGPAYTSRESSGELTSVLLEGVEALDAYYSQYLPQLALAALVPLTFLCIVFPIDWVSGLVLLITAPLIPFFMILIGNLAEGLTRRQWQTLSRMNAYFLDVLQGLTTLKTFGRSRVQSDVIGQVSELYRQTTMNVLRVTFLSALVLEMLATLSTAVVAVEVGLRLLYGRLAFEQAFFVLLLAPEFYLPLRLLGTRFHAGMAGVAAGKRIFEVLGEWDPTRPVNNKPSSTFAIQPPPNIRFEQVAFAYESERDAIKEVSFEIKAGQRVALVGPSGAGKSTLASLLLRFIEPAQGRILIDGEPLEDMAVQEWRQYVAWAPQKPHLFHATVAENIRLGKQHATQDEVIQAARLAQAHEFILELPQGYNTLISERGASLSAGQAQRIALARAFLKDAPVLILDEPTANLDLETQEAVQQALSRLMVGRTCLVIAHRLSTITTADQIIVLDQGQVVESGGHAKLQAVEGLYKRMAGVDPDLQPIPVEPVLPFDARLDNAHPISPEHPIPEINHQAPSTAAFLRLLKLVAPFKGQVVLSVLAGFATLASGIGLMSTSAYLISAAALQPSIATLQTAIVGVRFFGITRGVFRYLERYLTHQVTFHVLGRLRVTFYQALEPLAPARLLRYRSGDLLARISSDIQSLENFYVRTLAPPLIALMASGLACGLVWMWAGLTPALVLLCFQAATGLGIALLIRILERRGESSPGRSLIEQRGMLSAVLVDGIQGLADLLVFDQGAVQSARLQQADRAMASAQQRLAWMNGLQSALASLFTHLGTWVVLALSIPLVTSGQMEGVYLAVVTLTALTSFEAVLPLPQAAQVLESNISAARRLFEIVDARPEVVDVDRPASLVKSGDGIGIHVDRLRFSYPTGASAQAQPHPFALADVSFDVPPGKKLAVVGPSGAGKSTLVSLLLRFWEYRQGSIQMNGLEMKRYRQDDLRGQMAVVAQNTFLFHATLRENLLLAQPKATQADLERAVEMAQLHEFVQALPAGFDTWIGEQGVRLSAGQRQRLAIARAILKDAPLLLLDEPTANLDPLTEQALLRTLIPFMQGRSVIYITHRLVGMDWMDEILALHRGRVIERGRHVELLQQRGYYWKLYELQRQVLFVE